MGVVSGTLPGGAFSASSGLNGPFQVRYQPFEILQDHTEGWIGSASTESMWIQVRFFSFLMSFILHTPFKWHPTHIPHIRYHFQSNQICSSRSSILTLSTMALWYSQSNIFLFSDLKISSISRQCASLYVIFIQWDPLKAILAWWLKWLRVYWKCRRIKSCFFSTFLYF